MVKRIEDMGYGNRQRDTRNKCIKILDQDISEWGIYKNNIDKNTVLVRHSYGEPCVTSALEVSLDPLCDEGSDVD